MYNLVGRSNLRLKTAAMSFLCPKLVHCYLIYGAALTLFVPRLLKIAFVTPQYTSTMVALEGAILVAIVELIAAKLSH